VLTSFGCQDCDSLGEALKGVPGEVVRGDGVRLTSIVAATTVASPGVSAPTSAGSRHVLTGVTCGGPYTGDFRGETDIQWAAFAGERVSTRDASAS
jgi:hypothetical protein